ncbi:hypothetical protein HDV04_002442 [Boothiomyces sp. JEL0838]|nr:hypothetical protein HDV04_002442 [Boothiomyces sp. JEL0838]
MRAKKNQKRRAFTSLFDDDEYIAESEEELEMKFSDEDISQELKELNDNQIQPRTRKSKALTEPLKNSTPLAPSKNTDSMVAKEVIQSLQEILIAEGELNPKIAQPSEEFINYTECPGFPCLFSRCSKEFQQYNGLQYHLNNSVHHLSDLMILEVNQKPTIANKFQIVTQFFESSKDVLIVPLSFKFKNRNKLMTFKLKIDKPNLKPVAPQSYTPKKAKCVAIFEIEERQSDSTYAKFDINLKLFNSVPRTSALDISMHYKKEQLSQTLHLFGSCISRLLATKITWAPKINLGNDPEYFAVGGHQEKFFYHEYSDNNEDINSEIQIWKFNPDEEILPSMLFRLETNFGAVVDMKWCPNGAYYSNHNRLGFLAVVFGDGSLRIYNIPLYLQEIYVGKSVEIDEILQFVVPNTSLTTIQWSQDDLLAAGCSNGHIIVWNLKELLRKKSSNVQPVIYTRAHDSLITFIGWFHNNRYIVSGSTDGRLILTDIWDISNPFTLVKTLGYISCGEIVSSSEGVLFAEMDNVAKLVRPGFEPKNQTGKGDLTGGKIGLVNHNATIWSMSTSKYGTLVLTASADGTVNQGDLSEIFKKGSAAFTQLVTVNTGNNSKVTFQHTNLKKKLSDKSTNSIHDPKSG